MAPPRDRADATEVEIRFEPVGADRTRVDISIADGGARSAGEVSRDRIRGGWATLLPWFQAAAEGPRHQPRIWLTGERGLAVSSDNGAVIGVWQTARAGSHRADRARASGASRKYQEV